jgi:hypothetical protein
MARYNATERDAIRRDNRAMETAGVSMVDELEEIFAQILAAAIGITANAGDVDALALGGGHFTQDTDTTTGLTFGYKAGRFHNGSALVSVSAGTILLSASASNYVEVSRAGTVSANTSGFTAGRLPLWTIITGSSSITSVTISKPLMTLIGEDGITGALMSTAAKTKPMELLAGTISATKTIRFRVPVAGTIAAAGLIAGTTVAANDTNYWTFGIVNKGAAGAGSTVVVDGTAAANSTKATGGSAVTADVGRSFTLTGTSADLVVAAGDVLVLTITKTASASDLTDATVYLSMTHTA